MSAVDEVAGGQSQVGGDTAARIRHSYRRLSKGQRRVADLALTAPTTLALRSAAKIAAELGMSTSTVVRFAIALGYDGYPDFQRSLQSDVLRNVSTVNRLQVTRTQLANRDAPGLIRDVLERDSEYILGTAGLIAPDEFRSCVQWLDQARRVYILGLWSAHAPAHLLALGLRFIGIDTRLIVQGAGELADDLQGASSSDVLVGVSIGRNARRTIMAFDLARDRGLRRIAITDDPIGSVGVRADRVLCVKSGGDRFFKSVTAAVSVVNALITACVMDDPRRAERALSELEGGWASSGVHVSESDT